MHEEARNPKTGLYGPSVLSGEMIPSSEPSKSVEAGQKIDKKSHVSRETLYKPEGETVLINSICPQPSYILMSIDPQGHVNALPLTGGIFTYDVITIPVPKDTSCYENIKLTGEYFEFDTDADQKMVFTLNIDKTVPFLQVQIQAGTVGATAGHFESVYYSLSSNA